MPTKSKYNILPGEKYGNMIAQEYIQIITKEGNKEWRWKCIDDEGNIYHMRTRALWAKGQKDDETHTKSQEEFDKYVDDLEKTNANQMGLRRKYYQEYISNAVKRLIPFNLTFEQFNELISQPCYYCGEEPYVHSSMVKRANMREPMLKCVGIDRIDSSKFYDIENCVPCCSKCNYMKNAYGADDFLDHIEKIHNHQVKIKESSSTISQESTLQANGSGSGTLQQEI